MTLSTAPITEAYAEPVKPVTLRFQLLLAVANAGAIATLLPVLIVLIPAQTTAIDPFNAASSLALVMALGAFGAMIGHPLAGALSDRTTARLGRRRPWLLIGMAGDALGLALLASSTSVLSLALGWFTVQFFGNMMLSGYGAVVPDRVPVAQRGTTMAILGLASPVAIVISDLLFAGVGDLRAAYYPIIIANLLLTGLFVVTYREPVLPASARPPFRLGSFLASFWISPRRNPAFARVWVMWLLVWLGYTVATGGYFFLYLQNVIGFEALYPGRQVKEAVALLQLAQIVVGVPVMLWAGVLSDRLRSRKVFVLAGALVILAGILMLVFFRSWPAAVAASIITGGAFWTFYNLGVAMNTQLLPSASDRGKDLGVINIASTIPQIIMPFVGAAIVNRLGIANPTGYAALFAIAAAAMGLAILLIRALPGK